MRRRAGSASLFVIALLVAVSDAAAEPQPSAPAASPTPTERGAEPQAPAAAAPLEPGAELRAPAAAPPLEPGAVLPAPPAPPPEAGAQPQAAPPQQTSASAEPSLDLRWLQLMQQLEDPDDAQRRADAARAIGESGDPRGAAPLRHALARDALVVRMAAATALGAYRGPEVEAALANVLAKATEPVALRIAAAESLGAQDTENAAQLLFRERGDESSTLGKATRRVLLARYPLLYRAWLAALPHGQKLDQGGLPLLMLTMGLHGGYFMTALATVAGGQPGALSFIGGAAIGGVAPLLLSIGHALPGPEAFWITSTTTWGLGSGLLIGGASGLTHDNLLWASLGGQVAGIATGVLTRDVPLSESNILYVNAAGIAGMAAALGGVALDPGLGTKPSLAWTQVGLTLGLAAGLASARKLELDAGDPAIIVESTVASTWVGAWVPELILSDQAKGRHRVAGVLIGAAGGFAGGTLLSQYIDSRPGSTLAPVVGGFFGSAIGGGTGLLLHDRISLRAGTAMLLAGGGLGAAIAASASDARPYTAGDNLVTIAGMSWGLWHGLSIGWIAHDDGMQTVGAALLGVGVTGTASALLARRIHASEAEVGVAAASGVWGGWLAGWGAYVVRKHDHALTGRGVLLSALIGSDVGLGVGVLAVSPVLDVPEARLGWINLSGVLGMGVGTSGAAVFGHQAIAEGNLIGSAVGLIGGAIVTGFMDFDRHPTTSAGGLSALFDHVQPGFAFVPGAYHQPPVPVMTLSGQL